MKFDMMNQMTPKVAIAPSVVSNNAKQTSAVIDMKGYHALTFIIAAGTLAATDASFAITVKEGDTADQASHTEVADTFLIGTEALAGFTHADDNACRKIGYKGAKRFVSIEVTPTTNDAAANIAVLAILGCPAEAPTANPPA